MTSGDLLDNETTPGFDATSCDDCGADVYIDANGDLFDDEDGDQIHPEDCADDDDEDEVNAQCPLCQIDGEAVARRKNAFKCLTGDCPVLTYLAGD